MTIFNTEYSFDEYIHIDNLSKESIRFNIDETLNARFYIYNNSNKKFYKISLRLDHNRKYKARGC